MQPSRRVFVKGLAAAGVAGFAKPFFVHGADKADAQALIVGKDEHKYEVIDHWAKLPDTHRFGNTHGVAETADGRIIVHHQGGAPDSVCIFDPDGKFIKSWGKEYNGGAHGLQLRKEADGEFLYLALTGQHIVVKTDLEGNVIYKIGYPKDAKNAKGEPCYPDPNRFVPTNTAFHPTDGSFYVADGYGNNYVHHFNAKGEYVSTWGGRGNKDGELSCPHGIWLDSRDKEKPVIAVADRSNERISYFDLDGKFIKNTKAEILDPATGKNNPNAYRHPCHFDQRGEYLLVPGLHGVVSVLDKDNKIYTYLGDNLDPKARGQNGFPKEKLQAGIFVAPHGAIWTKAGDIYVGEWLSYGRVTKLRHLA